ncbi:aspartate--ammonia ligase [Scatolibacter rhodanostii]|uniref:aspartate--ammonia ligase n=1 Tax=Scatolibacter rhodanostii TaxID=2014781 RepID=UPI000C08152F|nr:aspartate--ammonia ligase [Scatolibacter rhodanostii]
MSNTLIPEGYKSVLNLYETQVAIGCLRNHFQKKLSKNLNLKRVSAPLFVDPLTGLNDDLNGIERAVSFDIKETGTNAQVVHSLAKWKRMALYRYKFSEGEGLYTDMNAIRRDEEMSNLHSIYVDQWDWEKVLPQGKRNVAYLKETVQSIINAFCDTAEELQTLFPKLVADFKRKVTFVTAQELEDLYPEATSKERENKITEKYKTVFILGIGDVMKSGQKHDGRAPDYDDWSMNGDILLWSDVLGRAIELSSMGIRVSPESLDSQLTKAGCDDRRELLFHKMLLAGELPLTMGGGIGQSRACMLLLKKAHVGEVQTSIWDEDTLAVCEKAGVVLL